MPKIELHCHLELAIRQSTLREWAGERGFDVSTGAAFAQTFLIEKPMMDLPNVLDRFLNTRDILDSEHLMERLAFEVCEDMFMQSNVRILELRYAPSFILDKHTHLQADRLQEAIQRGVLRAEQTYPIAVGLICILQRTKSTKENASWVDFALNHRHGFVALDLADNEVDFDPKPFIPLFNRAKSGGLGITVHAGEPLVPGISRNIRTAIERMGADRIGHGVQAIESPEVMALLEKTNTPLELCLTSNWLTGAVPSIAKHPFHALRENGVALTLNTDDPGIMCTNLLNEYIIAAQELGVDAATLQECNQIAYDHSFIPLEKRHAVWGSSL